MAECQEVLTQENMSYEDKTESCDLLNFRDVGNAGETYCPVCAKYSCMSCVEIRRQFHELVEIGESTSLNRVEVTDNLKCEIHWSETVAEYCLSHEKVICRLCKMIKHRNCDTSSIAEVAEKRKKNVKTFLEDIIVLVSELKKIESSKQKERKNILQMTMSLKAKVERIKEEIVTWAEKLQKDALERIEKTANGLLSDIDSHIAVSKEMTRVLTTVKVSFEKLGSDCISDRFVLMTKSKQQIQEGTELQQEIEKKIKLPTLNFYKSDKLSKLMSDICSLGTLETEETSSIDFKKISKLAKKTDIAVSSSLVTGCVFMPKGQLVICTNHTVKVLTSDFKLRNELKCDSQVWDVAFLSTDQVFVTKPHAESLDLLNVSANVKKVKSIPLGERCWGVEIKQDKIYVSCHSNKVAGGTIKVFTLDGVCMKAFRIAEGRPYYLAVNNAGDKIIVCTNTTSKVLCIDMTGNTISIYTNSRVNYSLGLSFDSYDRFVVCGLGSNDLQMVERDGTKHNILLSSHDGLSQPYCVAYRSSDRTFVVGQCATKSLVAYSFNI